MLEVILFVDRYSHNRRWKAHVVGALGITKYFGSMEANSLLHNFLPYLDPVTLGSDWRTPANLCRLDLLVLSVKRRYALKDELLG